MRTQVVDITQPEALTRALEVLQSGGLVAFPTDTVYGLGAPAFEPSAIESLFRVKERDRRKAIAVLLGDIRDMEQLASEVPPLARQLARHFWPGPLTLIVPRHPRVPDILSPLPTIGLRIPAHPLALRLLQAGGPLAVTSANLSGHPSPCTAEEVLAQLAGRIPLVLDGGRTPGGQPSTVVDCSAGSWRILRAGPIRAEQIRAVLAGGAPSGTVSQRK